jgi:hypothetical protein
MSFCWATSSSIKAVNVRKQVKYIMGDDDGDDGVQSSNKHELNSRSPSAAD